MLYGQMMERPLLVSSVLEHANRGFSWQEIAWRNGNDTNRYSVADLNTRARQLAQALVHELRITPGERVATLAWNTERHLELYFAIPGIGAVCHMLNPRYSDIQLRQIIVHAENRIIFVDADLLSRCLSLVEDNPCVTTVVVMDSASPPSPRSSLKILLYEPLLAACQPIRSWPEFDERAAASLCYTSGTTGPPRGVLYSHRSLVLYALCGLASGMNAMGPGASALLTVPMFHVNCWAKPHQALITGSKIVLPGRELSGASLDGLIEREGVTVGFGVPTIWRGYLEHMQKERRRPTSLRTLVIGGSRAPSGLVSSLETDLGLKCVTGFGMTETTAGLALGAEAPDLASADARLRLALLARQRPLFGVDTRIEQKEDSQSGMDGRPQGQLLCRGHYVASGYFRDDAASKAAITDDGWLRTGDVVATDAYGRIEVVDRAKDLIKSGGEWISSAELESQASLLSGVAEAAVIGIPHPKWEERPLLLVRCQAGSAIEPGAIIEQLRDLVPRWWMPEVCKIVDEIPKTATGKVDKKAIRANYSGWSYDAAGHLVRPHD